MPRPPRRKTATPIASSDADTGASPAASPAEPVQVLSTPTDIPEAKAPDIAEQLAPKADPNESRPKAPGKLADAAPEMPEVPEGEGVLLNSAKTTEPIPPTALPIVEKGPIIPKDLRDLAPKVEFGNGGRKLPQYDIRRTAIEATLAKGLQTGTGLHKLPPGQWRIARTQTVLIRGQVQQMREGTVVSSQTHDIRYLQNAGVVLHAVNDRARDMEKHGHDYDPRVG